jgi:MoaA/NifB/PqqE/SkfB family radical SAM enzyme
MPNLNISVGKQCFVQCRGCYNHFGKLRDPVASADILRFLAYARERGCNTVTFCGGDPLSRPDVIDLLAETKALGYRIKLDTVGTPILGDVETVFYGRRRVARIAPDELAGLVDMLGIPLDGADDVTAAAFRRGRPHLVEEQLTILRLLGEAGARTCLNTVLHKLNVDRAADIAVAVADVPGLELWQVFQYSPTGPLGFRNRGDFAIDTECFDAAVAHLTRVAREQNAHFAIEAKRNADRIGQYLLVDSDGLAWVPDLADEPDVGSSGRVIVGDIRDERDYARIASELRLREPESSLLAAVGSRG